MCLLGGYDVILVNLGSAGGGDFGQRVYASLLDIPPENATWRLVDASISAVGGCRGPILDEAIAIAAKVFWMQLGIVNHAEAARAREAGDGSQPESYEVSKSNTPAFSVV
ncbi:MAG: CoA-binding protein [Thermomicrobiales bacterium]